MHTILNKENMTKEQLEYIKEKAAQALLAMHNNHSAAYDVLRYAAAGFYTVSHKPTKYLQMKPLVDITDCHPPYEGQGRRDNMTNPGDKDYEC